MRQNPHVRICGGPGSATTLVYPTPRRRQGAREALRSDLSSLFTFPPLGDRAYVMITVH